MTFSSFLRSFAFLLMAASLVHTLLFFFTFPAKLSLALGLIFGVASALPMLFHFNKEDFHNLWNLFSTWTAPELGKMIPFLGLMAIMVMVALMTSGRLYTGLSDDMGTYPALVMGVFAQGIIFHTGVTHLMRI